MSRSRQTARGDEDEYMVDVDGDETMGDVGESDVTNKLTKSLVRYALACEYSRVPIRREGIREKVLGPHGRAFKNVFARAQEQLRTTFGMEMVELPIRDKALMTADQKRRAAKSQSQKEQTSNAWVLVSILPDPYKKPEIISPSKVQSADGEAAYVALYTTIISIITLSGGELSDPRLRRHLTRLNIAKNMPSLNPNNRHTPTEATDVLLQRMVKQGYLVKSDANGMGDEDSITWHVGPRGKVEVGKEEIAAFIRTVYGGSTDELEEQLRRSLKVKEKNPHVQQAAVRREQPREPREEEEVVEEPEEPEPEPSTQQRRRGRQTQIEMDEDDE